MKTRRGAWLVVAASMLVARAPTVSAQSADRLYELMRPLWQPQPKYFLREWLVCGEFPFPPHPGQKVYDHTPPCAGFDTDYLREHGGEKSIHPTVGMRHTRPDGTVTEWRQYTSDQDIIDLNKVFVGRSTENAVAYAFTTLTMAQPTRQFLALGSDDGIRLWLNGKLIHDHLIARGAAPDQDFVLADFKQGENTILLKIENGAGLWGFCCRLLEESSLAGDTRPYEPKIESPVDDALLRIRPDNAVALGPGQTVLTKVEVVAPGGGTVARAEISGGRDLILPTDEWPEGPYEVRCEMDLGFGNRRVKHLPWFKGDPKCAVAWLVDSLRDANLHTPEGMVHALLVDLVRDRLGGNPASVDNTKVLSIHSELMEFAELQIDRAGGKGAVHPYGFVRLAYRDEIDDSPQYCRAYLPPDYDPTRSWPLVINLHGRNADNPPYMEWENVDLRHHPWAEQYKAIVLEPHGRYNSWYKGLGVRDSLRCLELARQRFRVDEDRVYLTGASMGGSGVWEIGARYPELFAALAPVYGGWDDRIFVDNGALDRLTPRQRSEAEAYSSFARAESLLTTPVLVNHGTRDEFVDVNHARLAVGTLQRWGYEVEYWEHVDKGHDPSQLGHERTMLSWLLKHRRVRAPRHVRIRSPDLKSAAAHWVRVESSENPLSFIQVDADLVAPNFVRLNTDNVLAITLSPGPELADPALPLKVDWNGRGTPPTRLVQGKATLYASGSSPGDVAKRPELAGPLREVQTTPFALIVGTTSQDPRMRAFCARQANRIADEWQEQQHWRPRLYLDTQTGIEEILRYSLLLVGGPEENAVTRKLIDKLPLRFEGNRVRLGGKELDCPGAQIRMVYPHPLNPDRYVEVITATSVDAMYYTSTTRDGLGFRLQDGLDFYITDGRAPDAEAGRPDEKVCLASGFFDHCWQYSEGLTVFGDTAARASSPQERAPRYVNSVVEQEHLYLSDVLEVSTSGGFNDFARDLSFSRQPLVLGGKQYEKGLGVGVWRMWEVKNTAGEWDLSTGGWKHLVGVLGLQLRKDPAQLTQRRKDNTKIRFFVRGDGRELFKSEVFQWDTPPKEIDISVEGVNRLRLEVVNEGQADSAAQSANWADLRLVKAHR